MNGKVVSVLACFVFLGILSWNASAATPVSECMVISSPGVYTLTGDITGSTATVCIDIASDDVIFDGQGYTIDGIEAYGTYGVYSSGHSNVTVKNVVASDWTLGIFLEACDDSSILNNVVTKSNHGVGDAYGIYIAECDRATIDGNTVIGNSALAEGIYLDGTTNSVVSNNVVEWTYGTGFEDDVGGNNIFRGNVVSSCGMGMSITTFMTTILLDNTISSNDVGIGAENVWAYNNNFIDNTIQTYPGNRNGIWDNGATGNYWSDFDTEAEGCFDADLDGICDAPYSPAGGQDRYPLTEPVSAGDKECDNDDDSSDDEDSDDRKKDKKKKHKDDDSSDDE